MERNMFCMKELELHLAGIYGMKGQAKEMIDFYNMACSRLARGDNATGGIWRKTRSHIFSLHVEVMMIIKSASLDPDGETEMWRSKATESLHYLADKISRITTIMILAIYPAMHILIPILCDWIIFRLQSMLRHSQSRKSPSRLHTDMEEAKALRCIFSTCQKCWKRAPKSTIPTYPSLLVMLKGLRYLLDGKIAQFSHQILKGIKLIDATPALTKTFKSRLHARILRANAIETMASVRSRDGRVVDVNTIKSNIWDCEKNANRESTSWDSILDASRRFAVL
ncbi:hypothetical protein BC829DRAFT_42748 [Chytridium lagenaria]|nr:hypothetical protein BC829DRAFT_42748 [Chytridium lagenaria]